MAFWASECRDVRRDWRCRNESKCRWSRSLYFFLDQDPAPTPRKTPDGRLGERERVAHVLCFAIGSVTSG